jgi:hypothetical protein
LFGDPCLIGFQDSKKRSLHPAGILYLTLGTVYLILAKENKLFLILLDFHSFFVIY